jgi:hypothetical protein
MQLLFVPQDLLDSEPQQRALHTGRCHKYMDIEGTTGDGPTSMIPKAFLKWQGKWDKMNHGNLSCLTTVHVSSVSTDTELWDALAPNNAVPKVIHLRRLLDS